MIDESLSTSARALMKAAKGDGPSAAAKAKIWSGVSGVAAAGAGAGAAGAGGAAGTGSAVGGSVAPAAAAALGSGKLMAVGALLGSAVTVGLAMLMLRVGPASHEADHARVAAPMVADKTHPLLTPQLSTPQNPAPLPSTESPSEKPNVAPPALAVAKSAPSSAGNKPIIAAPEDPLLRESMLVAEARSALVRGDAASALVAIRATGRLSPRALEPEEMSIESRALRALSREDEAMAVDLRLKTRFPEHALAR